MCVCGNGDTRRFLCKPGDSIRLVIKGSLWTTLLNLLLAFPKHVNCRYCLLCKGLKIKKPYEIVLALFDLASIKRKTRRCKHQKDGSTLLPLKNLIIIEFAWNKEENKPFWRSSLETSVPLAGSGSRGHKREKFCNSVICCSTDLPPKSWHLVGGRV